MDDLEDIEIPSDEELSIIVEEETPEETSEVASLLGVSMDDIRNMVSQGDIMPVLDAAYIEPDRPVNTITREERHRLVNALKGLILTVTGTRPIAEAIVTAGGVSVKEINPKTMESKLIKNLYFAGEVVDVDGFTGGYNLQAAFSMGAAAGNWSVWNEED